MYIVVVGNVVYGFEFFGPFESREDAKGFAAENLDSYIVKLKQRI